MAVSHTPQNPKHLPPKPGEPELFRAARMGDHQAIARCVARGDDLNAEYDIGLDPGARAAPATPLMVAAGSGDGANVETVRLLLDLGADPKRTLNGDSAADFACRGLGWNYVPGGDAARLDVLLRAGSPLNLTGRAGARLVAETARLGDAERLGVLLHHGGPTNPVWNADEAQAEAAAMHACMMKHRGAMQQPFEDLDESLKDLLKDSLTEVESSIARQLASAPGSHETPLFQAALSGSGECVRLLLSAGADPRQIDNMSHTPLFAAGSAKVVRLLKAAGADLNHTSESSRDALQEHLNRLGENEADDARVVEVCRALIEVGLPLVHPPGSDRDRLYDAAFSENPGAVKFLLREGHAIVPPAGRATALHAICWHWDHGDERDLMTREIVTSLLQAGISPNARDSEGNTPLHEALSGDGTNLVAAEQLIAAGADVNARNNDGQTPLVYFYETRFDYARVVPFMLSHGANPLIPNHRGKNALDLARQMITGDNPDWRKEQWSEKGGPPCGWKAPAAEGDDEYRALAMLEDAARRF